VELADGPLPDYTEIRQSIFLGQKQSGDRSIGFGNYPELFTCCCRVTAQDAEAMLQAIFVLGLVFVAKFSLVTDPMAIQKIARGLIRPRQRIKCPWGSNNLTKGKERLSSDFLYELSAATFS